MIEIAGLIVSSIGLVANLAKQYKDLAAWNEADIEVDQEWLELALEKKVLLGAPDQFALLHLRRLPTVELRGTHAAVVAVNESKKLKYRIVMGSIDDRLILCQKLQLGNR
jgi:hypothetical protein